MSQLPLAGPELATVNGSMLILMVFWFLGPNCLSDNQTVKSEELLFQVACVSCLNLQLSAFSSHVVSAHSRRHGYQTCSTPTNRKLIHIRWHLRNIFIENLSYLAYD